MKKSCTSDCNIFSFTSHPAARVAVKIGHFNFGKNRTFLFWLDTRRLRLAPPMKKKLHF
jgi:hypothetical protein